MIRRLIILLFTTCLLFSQNNDSFNYLPKFSKSDQVIQHSYYTLKYDEKHEQASWVAYRLTEYNLLNPKTDRKDNFRSDPEVSTSSASLKDYKGSGYDRGHLAPAADFKWSSTAMSESFYMSNMSPQDPSFNRGIWKNLESAVRNWAIDNDEIYIVTGAVLNNVIGRIGSNRVSIPSKYYKVILDYQEPGLKAIGFLLPNKKINQSLMDYVFTVDDIERITGINFFHMLQDDIEERLESKTNPEMWIWE